MHIYIYLDTHDHIKIYGQKPLGIRQSRIRIMKHIGHFLLIYDHGNHIGQEEMKQTY